MRALDDWAEIDGRCQWHVPARDYASLRMGTTQGCRPEWLGDVRAQWRSVKGYLDDEFGAALVEHLMGWMRDGGKPDYRRAFPGGEARARRMAELLILAVASELQRILR
jgi:hypothetical protein